MSTKKRKQKREEQKRKDEAFLKSKWMDVDLESLTEDQFNDIKWGLRANYMSRIIGGVVLAGICIILIMML